MIIHGLKAQNHAAEIKPRAELITLDDLASRINAEHKQCLGAFQEGLEHAYKCGELLIQAKRTVNHGEWLPWLKDNTKISERTAQGYMRIVRNWGELEKSATIADLGLGDALKLLTEPGLQKLEIFETQISELETRLKGAISLADLDLIISEAGKIQNMAAEYRIRYERKLGEILTTVKDKWGLDDINILLSVHSEVLP